jgi:alkylated DNA repair dioxygenase AlkB
MAQLELFATTVLPEGFVYRPDLISVEEEQALVREINQLEFHEVKMHGVVARRRTRHFGLSYDYDTRKVKAGTPMPEFLVALRERLSGLTEIDPAEFFEVLLSEYSEGAGIGWHRDAPMFGVVAGISLLSACRMKLRPQPSPSTSREQATSKRVKPLEQILEPRSGYLLQGTVRWQWQHHIPPTEQLRYSITYRTLRHS